MSEFYLSPKEVRKFKDMVSKTEDKELINIVDLMLDEGLTIKQAMLKLGLLK